MDVEKLSADFIRSQFPILARRVHGKRLVYLDSGATYLKPLQVLNAMFDHYKNGAANIHRGVHTLSEEATHRYEGVRENVRAFIGAASAKEIIFTSGVTGGINLVAYSFGRTHIKAGDEVVLTEMEHHGNIVPWQLLRDMTGCTIKVVPISDRGELDLGALQDLLTTRTKLLALTHVSNVLGTINPIKDITAAAHSKNIPVLVDGAQAVAHIPVDVQDLDADFYVFSGHKLLATSGTGVLYGKTKYLEQMPPFLGGGDMIKSVTFEKTIYADLPAKFEAGTPNIGATIGLGTAIRFLQQLGWETIHKHEQTLLEYGTAVLGKIPGLRIIGTAQNKISIISFVVDGIHPHDLGTLLDQEGVAVRTGHHCAQPLMQRLGVPATVRACFSFYNTKDDVDILASAIRKAQEVFA